MNQTFSNMYQGNSADRIDRNSKHIPTRDIFDHRLCGESAKRQRLSILKMSGTNVYSSVNKSTENDRETMEMLMQVGRKAERAQNNYDNVGDASEDPFQRFDRMANRTFHGTLKTTKGTFSSIVNRHTQNNAISPKYDFRNTQDNYRNQSSEHRDKKPTLPPMSEKLIHIEGQREIPSGMNTTKNNQSFANGMEDNFRNTLPSPKKHAIYVVPEESKTIVATPLTMAKENYSGAPDDISPMILGPKTTKEQDKGFFQSSSSRKVQLAISKFKNKASNRSKSPEVKSSEPSPKISRDKRPQFKDIVSEALKNSKKSPKEGDIDGSPRKNESNDKKDSSVKKVFQNIVGKAVKSKGSEPQPAGEPAILGKMKPTNQFKALLAKFQLTLNPDNKKNFGAQASNAVSPSPISRQSPSPISRNLGSEEGGNIEGLYRKFLNDNNSNLGQLSTRKEAQILKEFLFSMGENLHKETDNAGGLVSMIESLVVFSTETLLRLMRTEHREYFENLLLISQYTQLARAARICYMTSPIETLENEIANLKATMKKIETSEAPAKEQNHLDSFLARLENKDDGMSHQVVKLKASLEALAQEKEQLNKIFTAKEKKYIELMNKNQHKFTIMKKMNEEVVEKYNLQCLKMNKIKARLAFYIKRVEQGSNALDQEELIDADLLKLVDEEGDNIVEVKSVDISDEEGGRANSPSYKGNTKQAGMEAVQVMDKFDYSIIYKRRHISNKSHSQRKNPKAYYPDSKYVKYYKNIIRTNNSHQDTKGLIQLDQVGTQTLLSFASSKFDNCLLNQYQLESYLKRSNFENKMLKHIKEKDFMCFITDNFMEQLLELKSQPSPSNPFSQAEDVGLMAQLIEHNEEFHESEEAYNDELKRVYKEDYFHLDMLDTYVNHRLTLPFVASEAILKYLFLSYAFELYSSKKKNDTIVRKETQVTVLFNLCRKYKDKIKEYDKGFKKLHNDLQTFQSIHKGCSVSQQFKEDFKSIETKTAVKEIAHLVGDMANLIEPGSPGMANGPKNTLPILTIVSRIKKLRQFMKMTTKKFFSFKIIYQKLYYFFIQRSSEVEYLETDVANPSVNHQMTLEEHFFRMLTEKESGMYKIEEKIKNFIITILNSEYNPKVENFKKFIGLSTTFNYGKFDEYIYLKALDFIKTECRGLEIPPDLHKGQHYVPFEKFEIFLQRFILPRLNARTAAVITREIKALVIVAFEGVSRKGAIEFDMAIEVVLKWMNAKTEYKVPKEDALMLFYVLDLEREQEISYPTFLHLYKKFNVDTYGEGSRLLSKVSHPIEIKSTIDHKEFDRGTNEVDLIAEKEDKPWFRPNYIYSNMQLKEIFCRYTEQNFSESTEPVAKLNPLQFHSLVNEFDNIFDFQRIYAYLKFENNEIENQYYIAMNNFNDNIEIYLKFINDCKIKDNPWKENFKEKIEELRYLFDGEVCLEELTKDLSGFLTDNGIDIQLFTERIRIVIMLKILILNRLFLIEILDADFEQRLDFAETKEIPFN